MPTFIGFSSNYKTEVLYDIDLIKKDLLNHFKTKKGERVMNAEYGFIGHDYLFEVMTTTARDNILNDAKRIISGDPRVSLLEAITITELDYGYQLNIKLMDNTTTTPFDLLVHLRKSMSGTS